MKLEMITWNLAKSNLPKPPEHNWFPILFLISTLIKSKWEWCRYIDTKAWKQEYNEEKKKLVFHTLWPFLDIERGKRIGNLKVIKNVISMLILSWVGLIMCLFEGKQPYKLDSQSLHAIELLRLGILIHISIWYLALVCQILIYSWNM